MSWTLTPDQFALAWARTDGDRIPYPLAVRASARDSGERAAQLPGLLQWCDRVVDADLEAALRILARPELRVEVFGQREGIPGDPASVRPVRVLGAAVGNVSVVAAQRHGTGHDRGGDLQLFVGSAKSLPARLISVLPENVPGATPRLAAPLARVQEDSRDLVTIPVAGPSTPAQIRNLLKRPRDGIGQLVVSVRRTNSELHPFGVLCWIDVIGDGRYAVRTGTNVDIAPVTATRFAAYLRPMLTAAERTLSYAENW